MSKWVQLEPKVDYEVNKEIPSNQKISAIDWNGGIENLGILKDEMEKMEEKIDYIKGEIDECVERDKEIFITLDSGKDKTFEYNIKDTKMQTFFPIGNLFEDILNYIGLDNIVLMNNPFLLILENNYTFEIQCAFKNKKMVGMGILDLYFSYPKDNTVYMQYSGGEFYIRWANSRSINIKIKLNTNNNLNIPILYKPLHVFNDSSFLASKTINLLKEEWANNQDLDKENEDLKKFGNWSTSKQGVNVKLILWKNNNFHYYIGKELINEKAHWYIAIALNENINNFGENVFKEQMRFPDGDIADYLKTNPTINGISNILERYTRYKVDIDIENINWWTPFVFNHDTIGDELTFISW